MDLKNLLKENCWSLPPIQNSHHLANPLEIPFEDFFQVVAPGSGSFHDDAELVVDEEAHIEENILQRSAKVFCDWKTWGISKILKLKETVWIWKQNLFERPERSEDFSFSVYSQEMTAMDEDSPPFGKKIVTFSSQHSKGS